PRSARFSSPHLRSRPGPFRAPCSSAPRMLLLAGSVPRCHDSPSRYRRLSNANVHLEGVLDCEHEIRIMADSAARRCSLTIDGHCHAGPPRPRTRGSSVMKQLVAARLTMVALAAVSAVVTIIPAFAARMEPPVPGVYSGQQPGTGTTPAPEPCVRISATQ